MASGINRALFHGTRWPAWLMALFGAIILVFVVHRAATASFTHDEAYSYNYYVDHSYRELITHVDAFTNNHLLNSVGMKAAKELIGDSEWALRTPNLLALALFLVYSACLLGGMRGWIALCAFMVLASNTYLMELFSMARGYGLSIGFMLMGIYHLVAVVRHQRKKDLLLFHLALLLSTLANLTLLNVYLAAVPSLFLLLWVGGITRKQLSSMIGWNAGLLAVSALVLWLPIARTLEQNAMDFGGKRSFFDSTVSTWMRSFFPENRIPGTVMDLMYAIVVLVVLLAGVAVLRQYRKRHTGTPVGRTVLAVVLCVFTGTIICAELQHALFGVDRMTNRFAIFLVPLFVVLLFEVIAWASASRATRWADGVAGVMAVWCAFSFFHWYSPLHSWEWQYDLRTKDAIRLIADDLRQQDREGPPVHVGINWLYEPSLNFYRTTMRLDALQRFDRDGLTPDDTYRLVVSDEAEQCAADGFIEMAAFPETGAVLFRAP